MLCKHEVDDWVLCIETQEERGADGSAAFILVKFV